MRTRANAAIATIATIATVATIATIASVATVVLALAAEEAAVAAERFPFVIPTSGAPPSAVDLSRLGGGGPASGPVRVEDGRLVDGQGRRLRLLGVNFSFGANFPEHADSERVAAHLARIGVNAVRHHHMDARDIWRELPDGKREVDPGKLERLAYLIARLAENGVYSNLNLHVSRSVTVAEGFSDAGELPTYNKYILYFDDRLQGLLEEYARALLTYKSPHTGRRLADEPSLATVEITNENRFARNGLRDLWSLPERYQKEFQRRWNVWLRERYGSTEKLVEVWGAGSEPLGPEIAGKGIAGPEVAEAGGAGSWRLSVRGGNRARLVTGEEGPKAGDADAARVRIEAASGVIHELELVRPGLSIEEGKLYTLSFWLRTERSRRVHVDVSRDGDPWDPVGFQEDVRATEDWKEIVRPFRATATLPGKARWIFKLGDDDADVWIARPSIRSGGQLARLSLDERIEDGSVRVPRESLQKRVAEDVRAFMEEIERRFFAEMHRFLREEIGVRAPITGSQADWQALSAFQPLDLVDAHAYWEHPSFPRRSWDMRDWLIGNTPMVRRPGGDALTRLAWYRIFGKPYTVSEYNHPAPSDYQAECVPLLCAFAALQDWDGVYIYSYQHGTGGWAGDRIQSFFDINGNPTKIALLATGAMLLRRGDVSAAKEEVNALKTPRPTRGVALGHRAGTELPEESPMSAELAVASLPRGEGTSFESDTGQVRWDASDPSRARFLVDAPRARVAVGFIADDEVRLGGLTLETGSASRGFGVVALVSIDGEPLERAERMLLTTLANAENTGMVWNEARTSVSDRWGSSPPLVEIVPVKATLKRDAASSAGGWKAFALDPSGARRAPVDVRAGPGVIELRATPAERTVWYEILRE